MAWNKKEELAYWTAEHKVYYIDNILKKWSFFNQLHDIRGDRFELAVDIGGGRFGGALRRLIQADKSILVDALASEFRKFGDLPICVDSITADFSNIPLKDHCADIVFAWNVFDHANSVEHFNDGMFEALRLLKRNGLLYGSFPLRKKPNNNHPICIDRVMIYKMLEMFNMTIMAEMSVHEPHYRDEICFLVSKKL